MSSTELTLRDLIEQRFTDLKILLDERRQNDLRANKLAKENADEQLQAHNELIKRMERQAVESQRQLDKLTDTYATKENLESLETLIDARLMAIEQKLTSRDASKQTLRGVWHEARGTILAGFVMLGVLIALATYIARN